MKYFCLNGFLILIISASCFGQKPKSQRKLVTYNLGGTYGYGNSDDKPWGSLVIYPDSDSTVLFHISVNKGKPSYNSGALYGRILVTGSEGFFSHSFKFTDKNCRLTFQFLNKSILIRSDEDSGGCGFGAGVVADGEYKIISSYIPRYFESGEGKKIFFKDLSFTGHHE